MGSAPPPQPFPVDDERRHPPYAIRRHREAAGGAPNERRERVILAPDESPSLPSGLPWSTPLPPDVSSLEFAISLLRHLQQQYGAIIDDVDVRPEGGVVVVKIPLDRVRAPHHDGEVTQKEEEEEPGRRDGRAPRR